MMTESTGDSFEPPAAREFAHDDSNMSADEDEKFTYKDVLTGLGFAAVGSLILLNSVLAAGNGWPAWFWLLGFVVGPFFVLAGCVAIYRGLRG